MTPSEVLGVWRRSSIVLPDGARDDTSFVVWTQAARHFVDLRQPEPRPSFAGVASLRDLTRPQLDWMARQEGFAGELAENGVFVEWRRALDFQPPTGRPDAGRLWMDGATLVEQGRDSPYVERWEPLHAPDAPSVSLWLSCGAREGAMARHGDHFLLMRGRVALVRGTSLAAAVEAASSLAAAQDLFDCEIAYGRVTARGWSVERSTLPFREGRVLHPRLDGTGWAIDGETWRVTASGGALSLAG